ncbi:MAG: hypothetical protein L6Q97_17965, partial [Thermoanaerobaculia bacterium]|nr:hypothetical protein [Thermoanaerobaculia bacterium]
KTEAVTPEELAKIKKILVKNLGTNYLDAGWKAVLKEGAADLDYSPKELARILVEWEETMKEAYPTIWASYQAEFEAHTEKTKLSKGLLEQQAVKKGGAIGDLGADDKIMKSWVIGERNNRAYAKGLVAIKAGDESEGEGHYKLAKTQYNAGRVAAQADTPLDLASSDAFKHGYQDYEQGRTDAEADPVRPLPGGHNLAYNVAYKEYLEGYQAASNTPDTALADNSRKAYTAGYNAYRNGYLAARAQPGVALAVPLSPAYTTAYTEYQNGYQAALAMPGVILFGGHSAAYMKAYNDFQQGYSAAVATPDAPMAHSPSQAYTNGYAQYKNGYEAAVATPLVVLAGLHPQAYTNGYIHYRNGYLNAFQNAGLPIFIHRAYQLGDAAGTNQRHANQNAVNSGKRRKF